MNNNFSKQKFNNILDKLNIKKGDTVLVSSNILNFILKEKNFRPERLIDYLKKKITSKGTLIFPTYSWDFCEKKSFDYNKTKTICGALSNISLMRKDFKRTKNPIFSFSVFGSGKNILCKMPHSNCFSINSPFGYLIKKRAKHFFINLDYKEAMTFVHVAEQVEKVKYRYEKIFHGNYINKFKKIEKKKYKMFVRKKYVKATFIDSKFDKILKKNNAIKNEVLEKINFSIIDIHKTFNLMRKEINKKSGLIKYV